MTHIVAIRFGSSDRTYDYFVPEGLTVEPGQKVIVETKRGEATVEVVAVKTESDLAWKPILRIAEPEQAETESPS